MVICRILFFCIHPAFSHLRVLPVYIHPPLFRFAVALQNSSSPVSFFRIDRTYIGRKVFSVMKIICYGTILTLFPQSPASPARSQTVETHLIIKAFVTFSSVFLFFHFICKIHSDFFHHLPAGGVFLKKARCYLLKSHFLQFF